MPANQDDTPHVVVCGVSDEGSLRDAHEELVRAQVRCCPYLEPDFGGSLTAVAVGPLQGQDRKVMRKYRLL